MFVKPYMIQYRRLPDTILLVTSPELSEFSTLISDRIDKFINEEKPCCVWEVYGMDDQTSRK